MEDVHTSEELAPKTNEYVPLGHLKQVLIEIARTVVEYLPMGHKVQEELPKLLAYVPDGQSWHEVALIVFENVPNVHFVHPISGSI